MVEMALIGLVGEAPNDTDAIRTLLGRKYPEKFQYKALLNKITGSQLDSGRAKRSLRIEYEDSKPELVVFIRDLDGFQEDTVQLKNRKDYFRKSNNIVDDLGVFLLSIYSLEALLLYDLELFNTNYGSSINMDQEPMTVNMPKEYLMENSNLQKYKDCDNPNLFSQLDLKKLDNCNFLSKFYTKFEKKLTELGY